MKSNFGSKVDSIIDNLMSYDGIDSETLQFKRTTWLSTIGITTFVLGMFIPVLIFQVKSLLLFGILLLCVYIPSILLMIILPYKRKWMVHVTQHLTLIITFFIIVKLGGLHNSGGIILAGLSMVMASLMFNSVFWSVWYFSFYMFCMIVVSIIQFRFNLSPEMSPEVNHVFFLINTLCLTGYTLIIILVYLNQRTQAEKDKADRLKELDEAKTKLYTNITHEFRTPLTIILGMSDQIEIDPDKFLKVGLKKIRTNSKNLLNLVNQMLNLAKLEAGAMPLRMVNGDVIKYIRLITESFHAWAGRKMIIIDFKPVMESFFMDYDQEILTTVVSNLLSNAIKYTQKHGHISIRVSEDNSEGPFLHLKVSDSGIGIADDKLGKIFDRFYRNSDQDYSESGSTGLGLAITKEMVKLVNGKIVVESKLGEGTTFLIKFPVENKVMRSEQDIFPNLNENILLSKTDNLIFEDNLTYKSGMPVVLIVEDNPDVADYLSSLLRNNYRIKIATNGKTGFDKALSVVPDIIISDIMMPVTDGIEMLRMLRKDYRTSHIPVILLTAKADIKSRLIGFEEGAEAYLAKPFNKEELFIRLRMLIEVRKKLRERYSSFVSLEQQGLETQDIEGKFMKKVYESFRENLDNENFGTDQLCKALAMSRAQLYRKFKVLTNRSVKEYLRSFRLQTAKQLLSETNLNITSIAYQVGFKNLSHFSFRFRKEFGIKPGEIRSKVI